MSNALIFLFFLIQIASVYAFYRIVNAIEAHSIRIARLENQKPAKPEPKAPERVQARQIFEKPIVPGAKEVQPLPIGGGKLKFDNENQVAEWI